MTRSPGPDASSPHDQAWDFLTGSSSDEDAEALLTALETNPDTVRALCNASDDLIRYRSLGDTELRAAWAGPGADGIDVDEELALDHDPDTLLDAAITNGEERVSAWERFRRFARRPSAGVTAGLLAAAAALFVVTQGPAPVPDYTGDWRNGASATRAAPDNAASTSTSGVYMIGNEAALVIRPVTPMETADPDVRVFLGQAGGSLVPVAAETELGRGQSVRVLLPITAEIGTGTHRVVVLVGRDLEHADPETDTDDWARFETTMQVKDAL
jgi:hypothetical protein